MASIGQVTPIATPPPEARALADAEARCTPRTPRRSRAQLILYPAGRHVHAFDVEVVDYSATGIGIIHSEDLLIGQIYVLREPYVTRNNTCLFTVVRSNPLPDGTWSIGLHVGNTLADELAPIIAETPAPGIDLWTRLLFLAFAISGVTTIILLSILHHRGH